MLTIPRTTYKNLVSIESNDNIVYSQVNRFIEAQWNNKLYFFVEFIGAGGLGTNDARIDIYCGDNQNDRLYRYGFTYASSGEVTVYPDTLCTPDGPILEGTIDPDNTTVFVDYPSPAPPAPVTSTTTQFVCEGVTITAEYNFDDFFLTSNGVFLKSNGKFLIPPA